MQTAPAFNPQNSYQMGASFQPSYYPNQSYIDPRSYNPNPQGGYGYNYQPYYNESMNASYSPYYGMPRHPQSQRQSAQYINPQYNYEYNPRYSNKDARYHQRVETYNLPTNYRNKTGQLPTQPIKNVPNPNYPNAPPIKEVIYEQQPLQIPQSVRNVQYIPKLHRFMDYVEERVKIPVQKYYTDYYEVQHVTDFVPRQYQDTVIEMVPQQIVRYRLQYVPVERKIVHMPKKQIYDENGLYLGVGNLSDKIQIGQAVKGLVNEGYRRASNEVSRTIYDRNSNQIRGLDQSLVDAIGKDMQNQARNQAQINRNIYENLKNNMGSPTLSRQDVSRTMYDEYRGNVNSPTRFGSSGDNINEMMAMGNVDHSRSKANYSNQGSRVSRRKTNFVTSDGYFPKYDEELKNLGTSY